MGTSEITAFNHNPSKYPQNGLTKRAYQQYNLSAPQEYAIEQTADFNDGNGMIIPSTLKKIITAHGKNLFVWVANNCWTSGGTKAKLVTQSMIDQYAPKFLNTGTNDDIYEWVSNLAGSLWGTHSYGNMIDGSTADIHIWLYDINNDNSTTGGVCGYFWSLNNYKKTTFANSNEKVMFVIDAVLFATPTPIGGTWEITDYWPQFMISTLAHEFQHMIEFYEKYVLRSINVEVWINEMASQCAEDLVASKMLSNGPRGVTYSDFTAGATGNASGRLPLYNANNTLAITDWSEDTAQTYTNYSKTYAFGAYLTRNYGGANFIKSLVQNSYGSTDAVNFALTANGYTGVTFGDALRNFGAANLVSNLTTAPAGYRINSGAWNTSTVNGIDYTLGSINLYNYSTAPYVYNDMPTGSQNKASNIYYNAGTGLSGTKEWVIANLDADVKMTVVVK